MRKNNPEQITHGELKEGELHPAAHSAMDFVFKFVNDHVHETMLLMQSFESTASAGNRLSQISHETLRKVIKGESINDKMILGLAWTIREMQIFNQKIKKKENEKKMKDKKKK